MCDVEEMLVYVVAVVFVAVAPVDMFEVVLPEWFGLVVVVVVVVVGMFVVSYLVGSLTMLVVFPLLPVFCAPSFCHWQSSA